MTQYHFLDESGDPGFNILGGASSHFVLALVQLPTRAALPELAELRRLRRLSPAFEFKYHKTTKVQKRAFFKCIEPIPFRVRAVVVDKVRLGSSFRRMNGRAFMVYFLTHLTLRASPLDIANDVLVIDGATPALRRASRVSLSKKCRETGRIRPFKKIVGGDSKREDGLQLADMIAGAIMHHVVRDESTDYTTFSPKIVDFWPVPDRGT